ncbi:15141_t:CDS:1, partial [Gigaspora rosea]
MSEDFTKLVTYLLKRNNLTVTIVNDTSPEYSIIKVSFQKFTRNLIIWRKKISSTTDFEKLHDSSLGKDENWIIVAKSLINENQIDMIVKYSNKTNKYIKIRCVDEFEIIYHLKKLYFDEYANLKKIKSSEK